MSLKRSFLFSVAVLFFLSITLSGSAQDIKTISHGDRVDLSKHLVPGKLVVFDFYADWCGPCRSLAPKLEGLARANSDLLVVRKIDIVDWRSQVAAQYGIRSIPHLKLFDENGRLLAEGNAYEVLKVVIRRTGGAGMEVGGGGHSIVPLIFIGGLIILVLFFLFRGRSSKRPPVCKVPPRVQAAETTASGWFVMMQNSFEGPFSEELLKDMLRAGEISGGAKARRRGQSNWTTVDEIVKYLI